MNTAFSRTQGSDVATGSFSRWLNMWDGVMLPGEWQANFKISTEDLVNLAQILRSYSFGFASSVPPQFEKKRVHVNISRQLENPN